MEKGFSMYHPITNAIYYMAVIGTAMFVMHPVYTVISFFSAAIYEIYLNKRKGIVTVVTMIPVFLLTSLINPLFSHRGMTLLCYLPTGNPLTMESILYGLSAGLMIVTVILWFATFHTIMTSDRILCICGRIIPSLGMVIGMVLRFVPMYANQAKKVSQANELLGVRYRGRWGKVKQGFHSFGIMVSWSLENAIITADSMKARGYGAGKRTVFSVYKFGIRDIIFILVTVVLTVMQILLFGLDFVGCIYYPRFYIMGAGNFAAYFSYGILCLMPMVVSIQEDMIWNRLQSKI